MAKVKLKVIRGDKERGEEVVALLESLGGINPFHFIKGIDNGGYYYINNKDNVIYSQSIESEFFNDYELEILELPIKFKPFDKVLVRDTDDNMWCCGIFSHILGGQYVCVGGQAYLQCISYIGNEELLGTNKNK